jgi:23S rRNA G2445 N2-methylase RlmL
MNKSIYTERSRIVITCSKRLSPYLDREVQALGYEIERVFATGVELFGTVNDCIRLNLNLRCASQVHYSLLEFPAKNADEVYRTLSEYAWENLITKDGYFSVTCNVDTPTINNTMFVNVKVKDAIVDRIRSKTTKRPDSGSDLSGAVIYLFWKDSRAEVFVDTSGETLSKHGYRKIPGKAPMLEALAASTLLAGKWDQRSPFVNPMCGSGTIAIEAALLATNRRPGLLRNNYSYMHFVGYDDAVHKKEKELLKTQIREVSGLVIIASDNREDAISISKVNAAIAGVEHLIKFQVCDFQDTELPEQVPGVIYFNPEYGERLGEISALESTYAAIGDFLKQKCQGYMGYVFTANLELAKKIGLRASRRIEFYTAKLDCRLLEFEMYAGTRRSEKISGEEIK